MSLDLTHIFEQGGELGRTLPGFVSRPEQLAMAERVAATLAGRGCLVLEAGTGTGKTFGYLVPALLSGLRTLVSTGTRTLQDQLFGKDLPLLAKALGRPVRVALLKGRANYLCRHRLDQARHHAAFRVGVPDPLLERVASWAEVTRSGDLAEMPGFADSHPLWREITSTRDNCLGQRCPEHGRCHLVRARRQAQESELVIVNHHLLLADLTLKEDGFGDLLGTADAVILDEAHQLPDLAMQSFGDSAGSRRIDAVLQAVRAELPGEAVLAAAAAVEGAVREVAAVLPRRGRTSWELCVPALWEAASTLGHALGALAGQLEAQEAGSAGPLATRAAELSAALDRITGGEGARTVEVGARSFALQLLPFEVAARFRALMRARPCAWVFTSATLSVGEDFGHFTARLGLEDAQTVKIPSPFDYARQSLLYLPEGLPEPAAPGHTRAVLSACLPLIEAAGGGAFILFTSHRALGEAAALLRQWWGAAPPYRLYVQAEAPREQLLRAFREDGDGVLLGTASFWEGVDVQGAALRVVVIEKLPFASPEDPIVKARIEHIESQGGNAFRDYQLPEAALALRQGVGRLIRSEQDHGAVMICDRRLTERAYGRLFLASLPPMRRTRDRGEAVAFLAAHPGVRPGAAAGPQGGSP